MYKFFTIIATLIATVVVAHKSYVSYYHKGCQVRVRSYRIIERPFLIGLSLSLAAMFCTAFWAELSKLSNWMTYYETGDVIFANIVTTLLLAYGYYTALRKMIAKLQKTSRTNAVRGAKNKILSCKLCCYNAPAGEDSRLPCNNKNVLMCPCAAEWDVLLRTTTYDVRDALRKVEKMPESGTTEIGVYADRIVRKDAKDAGLSAALEQAYIGQLISMALVARMPDGNIHSNLRNEKAETFRVC